MKPNTTTTPRSSRGIPLLLGPAALCIIQPRAQAQVVIYSDTFERGSVETPLALNGSTPDATSGLYGGTSGATWGGGADWVTNGADLVSTDKVNIDGPLLLAGLLGPVQVLTIQTVVE